MIILLQYNHGDNFYDRTLKAMGGDVSFREALSERLKIVRPSLQQVQDFVASRPPQLSEGIEYGMIIVVVLYSHVLTSGLFVYNDQLVQSTPYIFWTNHCAEK